MVCAYFKCISDMDICMHGAFHLHHVQDLKLTLSIAEILCFGELLLSRVSQLFGLDCTKCLKACVHSGFLFRSVCCCLFQCISSPSRDFNYLLCYEDQIGRVS